MLLERLLDNLTLEVEAFATCQVASGWRLRLPSLDWVTVHYIVQGRGELRSQDTEPHPLSAGSLALVPPRLIHSIQCGPGPHGEESSTDGPSGGGLPVHRAGPDDTTGLIVICGRVRVLFGRGQGLFDHLREPLALDFEDDPDMEAIFDRLRLEFGLSRPGSVAMATALMSESLIHVLRRLCSDANCTLPWLRALEDPDLRPALEAMLSAPHKPHTVASLAHACHMSRSTFARRFKVSFGRGPMEYLREVRLRKAAKLLRKKPPPSVVSIASQVGFDSRSQFSRAFRDYFAYSPSEFTGLAHVSGAWG